MSPAAIVQRLVHHYGGNIIVAPLVIYHDRLVKVLMPLVDCYLPDVQQAPSVVYWWTVLVRRGVNTPAMHVGLPLRTQ